jgi:hypothetical protein
VLINNIIAFNIGMTTLVGILFGMHMVLAKVFINSMVMVDVIVGTYLGLTMVYTPFGTILALVQGLKSSNG